MKTQKLLTNFVIIIVFLAIGFGCKLGNISNFDGGISESTDPKEAISIAFKKFQGVSFYHSVTTTKTAQAVVQTETDFNAPDKFWIKNSVAGTKSEVIVIGNESFSRLSEGKWSKMPENQMSATEMRKTMSEEAVTVMKDFEFVGKENLNGKDAFVYKFKSTYGGESASKIWIVADSGLPMRVDTEGNFGGTNMQMSTTYDFDQETKIEAPKVS